MTDLISRDAHVLETDGRCWPVVDGIPYLRAGRERLADNALDALAHGDERAALALLLTDRDDWAPGAPITTTDTRDVIALVEAGGSLRAAMRGLGYGPVADYFAHRWSDPTYLSGLSLLRESWPTPRPRLVELACGIGQLLAAAAAAGASTCGIDVVFSKLWLARRFVAPSARLLCLDVDRQPLPLDDGAADGVVVHDALYFLEHKQAVLEEARRVAPTVAVGHAHNALVDNLSAGRPLDPTEWSALLPAARCFDDLELTASWLENRPARSADGPEALTAAAAMALVDGPVSPAPVRLGRPRPGRPLRLNPLLTPGPGDPVPLALRWPSPRYEAEYRSLSCYLDQPAVGRDVLERALGGSVDDTDVAELVRRRIVLDLPERW